LIEKYFHEVELGINLQAEVSANIRTMKKLSAALKKSGLLPVQYQHHGLGDYQYGEWKFPACLSDRSYLPRYLPY
ncbi:MAG: hypothetical protein D3904_10195, partial [Candidatus Electrothrix sp. EH2]|nr:hypothetical protein [Candidatus Electrothrix sp. EH2]